MIQYRTSAPNDTHAVCALYGEVRKTYGVKTWPLPFSGIDAVVNMTVNDPNRAFAIAAIDDENRMIGCIACLTHKMFGELVGEELGLVVSKRYLTKIAQVTVTRNLIRRAIVWSKSIGCAKMLWSTILDTGETYGRILEKEGARCVGVVMELDFDGKSN